MRFSAILMLLLAAAGGLLTSAVSAQEAAFGEASLVAGDANTFVAGPFALDYLGTLYEYATNEDGKGHYTTTDDGQTYTGWTGWDDQPADFQWQPTSVVFGGNQYLFYDGQDGGLYHNAFDGSAWGGWENLAGDFTFDYAPFANTYQNAVYLYSVANTNDLHYKIWSDGNWSGWEPVNDRHKAGPFQPFALAWGDQENVFWTGTDGKVYWNRSDGTAWSGAEALPFAEDGAESIQFAYAPFAVGYVPEQALYAYAIARDGTPFRNVYTEEDAWSGWEPYGTEAPAPVMNQPSVSVYAGKQHMVYTGQDNHAYYTFYDGAWGDWQDLGDNVAFDPFQYEFAGNLHLTYTGVDGDVYVRPFSGALASGSTQDTGGATDTGAATGVTTELLGRHLSSVL